VFSEKSQKADIIHLIYGSSDDLRARLARRRRRVSFVRAYAYMTRKGIAGLYANTRFITRRGTEEIRRVLYRNGGTPSRAFRSRE